MMRKEIGERVRGLRESSGYTREELADKTQLSTKFLYEIESGKKGISAESLLKISKALSSSCDYILTGEIAKADEINYLLKEFNTKQLRYMKEIIKIIQKMY